MPEESPSFIIDPNNPDQMMKQTTQESSPISPDPLATERPQHVTKMEAQYKQDSDNAWKKFMGDKLRTAIPDLQKENATDDEAIATFHGLLGLQATQEKINPPSPDETVKVLGKLYPDYKAPLPKPSITKYIIPTIQDWVQGAVIDPALALPRGLLNLMEGLHQGGIEIAPGKEKFLGMVDVPALQVKGKTPEAATEVTKAGAHFGEAGAFAAALGATGGVGKVIQSPIQYGLSKFGTNFLGRRAIAGIAGAAEFGTFGATEEAFKGAEQSETPQGIFNAFMHGAATSAPLGALVGAAIPPLVLRRAHAAGRAAQDAKSLPEAKAAAAKVANAYQPEWAAAEGDPVEIATEFIKDMTGDDVVASEAGQRAIQQIGRKIVNYRKNLKVSDVFKEPVETKGLPLSDTAPKAEAAKRELSTGDTSDWENPNIQKKQVQTAQGPSWAYAVDMGGGNVEIHYTVAKSADAALKVAKSNSDNIGGKFVEGSFGPEYELAKEPPVSPEIERRISPGLPPEGVERRTAPREELQQIADDAKGELQSLEHATSEELKAAYAEKYPEKEIPTDIEAIRNEFKGEAQTRLSGARSLLKLPEAISEKTTTEIIKEISKKGRTLKEQLAIDKMRTVLPELPQELAQAKPKYGYQDRLYDIRFESDVDKALYITAQTKKSARDASYRTFLESQGYTPKDIDTLGQQIRAQIKAKAKDDIVGDDGKIHIPSYAEEIKIPSGITRAEVRAMRLNPNELLSRADKPSKASYKDGAVISEGGVTAYKGTISRIPDTPETAAILRRIQVDPIYKKTISDLGGGRSISHEESLTKAARLPMMSVEELAGWSQEYGVNEIDVVRANILRAKILDDFQQALFENNIDAAKKSWDEFTTIQAGYDTMKGTPGRSTEIQKLYKINTDITDKIKELKSINAPFEQVVKELGETIEKAKTKLDERNYTPLWFRNLEDFATAAKLSSPVTHTVNTVSNFLVYLQRSLEKTTESAILKSMGRDVEAEATLKYATGWGIENGFIDAMRTAKEVFNADNIGTAGKAELTSRGSNLPYPVQIPFRALAAADAFWKSIIRNSELHTKAYIQAIGKEGLVADSKEAAARIKELVENAPEAWKEHADLIAKEYTFQEQPDRFLKAIQTFQNVPGFRLFIPFVQTPYNLMRFYVRRSPLMLIPQQFLGIRTNSWYRDIAAGGARQANAISRLAIGTGLHAAAFYLVKNGQVTGAWPTNPAEAAVWKLEGKQPYAIKIGNYWFNYNRLQPVGSFLSAVAAWKTAYENDNFSKAQDHLGRALGQLIKGPLDVPFLQGMSAAFDMVNDPERSFKKFVDQTAAGIIPNFLRDIRLQMDPTVRKAKNWGDMARLMIPIPSVYEKVAPAINVLGEETKAPKPLEAKPIPIIMRGMANPATDTEITHLLNEIGWAPPAPNPKFDFQGEEAELTPELEQRYRKDMGAMAKAIIQATMKHPDFGKLDANLKKKALARNVSAGQTAIRDVFKVLSGVYGPQGEAYKADAEAALQKLEGQF